MSILSWDDFEEPQITPVTETPQDEIKQHIPTVIPEHAVTQAVDVTGQSEALQRAAASVERMKEEDPTGERVKVEDKYLLNCQTDLNQLVPFKYNWSWSLYLTSCNNHWGPGELELEKDAEAFKALMHYEKQVFHNAYTNYKIANVLHSDENHLRLYALITNPECRQTILKQLMERAVIHHAWTEVEDALGVGLTPGFSESEYSRLRQMRAVSGLDVLNYLTDAVGETETIRGQNLFLFTMGHYYFHLNLNMILPCYYQMWCIAMRNNMPSIVRLVTNLIRDIQSQVTFAKIFLETAIAEKSITLEDSIIHEVNTFIREANTAIINMTSDYTPEEDVEELLTFLTNYTWVAAIPDISPIPVSRHSPHLTTFIELFKNNAPTVDHDAGISGTGASLTW